MSEYNYDSFSPNDYDFKSEAGPAIGEHAPNFQLISTDGLVVDLLAFEGDYLVLELGSVTCPLFHTRRQGMQTMQKSFADVSFAVLYVREAHPGLIIPAHKNIEDKQKCAARLTEEDGDTRKILVDGIEGRAHKAYGSLPNAVYIIDKDGIVRFKSLWNNPVSTQKALNALVAGIEVDIKSYFAPAKPSIVLQTAARAGKGSAIDFFKGLPMLIWNNLIKLNVRTFLSKAPKP